MRNAVILNYIAQFYSAISLLIVVPIYIKLLGSEAYGLVAFFIMLQAWLQVLEAGISGSITRVIAISKNHVKNFQAALLICWKIIFLFFLISIIILLLGRLSVSYLIEQWFKTSIDEYVLSVSLFSMFSSLALRYFSGPFKSILIGLEKHVEISLVTIIVLTLKYPLSVLYIIYFSKEIEDFFLYQALICIVELLFYVILSMYSVHFSKDNGERSVEASDNLNLTFIDFFKFSIQLSILSISWVVVTQIDKLVLSKYMTLGDYGFYSLAVSLSGAILIFAAPLNQILMPKLTGLFNLGDRESFYRIYFISFSVLSIISISLGVFLFAFGWEVVFLWTNEKVLATKATEYLGYLSLGNSISVLMSMVFLLLFCSGDLKKHTMVYVCYSMFLVPASIVIASRYGGYGASMFWLLHNAAFFIFWGCRVIYKYFGFQTLCMVLELIFTSVIFSFVYFSFWVYLSITPDGRFALLIYLAFIGISNVLVLFLYFSNLRVKKKYRYKFNLIDSRLLFK
jgi:O-antigen/teichoic acid export membrane protein